MKQIMSNTRFALLVGVLVCLCWCAGCGPGAHPKGSVSGKATYKGKPITSGMVLLVNYETGASASGELDSSGQYHIPSLETGEYKVAITRPRTPGPGELERGLPMPKLSVELPRELTDPQTSGLAATVEEGKNTADFSL